MTMPKSTLDVSRMFIIGGACIALLIGSGFATGQEIMQYFVAYGHAGLISILLMFALFTYVSNHSWSPASQNESDPAVSSTLAHQSFRGAPYWHYCVLT